MKLSYKTPVLATPETIAQWCDEAAAEIGWYDGEEMHVAISGYSVTISQRPEGWGDYFHVRQLDDGEFNVLFVPRDGAYFHKEVLDIWNTRLHAFIDALNGKRDAAVVSS